MLIKPLSRSDQDVSRPQEPSPLALVTTRPLTATLRHEGTAARQAQIRVVIADDHPIVCNGLRALLTMQCDFDVVGEAHDGAEALRLALELKPDIMLLDFSMPKLSGVEVVRQLADANAAVRTIVLTVAIEHADILKLLRLGARGVLRKDAPLEHVFKSIRKVHSGDVWVPREIVAQVVDALALFRNREHVRPQRDFGLTKREKEVLLLVVEGDTNKGIAKRLSVGEDTVKHHLTNIFDKTGVSSRLELALFALHHRLVTTI